ncbi:MAG: thioredoxin-disulfide reductase [Deltaproteobacteria bacterium]|nr:MAG: thioredoxin-disulfide reductase [Deltaproteobacteria bacterium]
MKNIDYDLVIIGGGPAGLTAGIYAKRAGLSTLLLEKHTPGGQIMITDWIENYPGFPEGLAGYDLTMKMEQQAKHFGLEIIQADVKGIKASDETKEIILPDKTIISKAIIIASGCSPRKLGIPGENIFFGKGVSTCATCDGMFFRDKEVVAIGGGDTAVQEAIFLTKFASRVYLVHRRDQLRATKILQDRVFANEKIEIIWDSVATEINGDKEVQSVTIKNVKTEEEKTIAADGCFIWVGTIPNTEFISPDIKTDKGGFIITDSLMNTSVKGIFAAGDVRNTPLRQVSTAVGDAAIAAVSADKYIESL